MKAAQTHGTNGATATRSPNEVKWGELHRMQVTRTTRMSDPRNGESPPRNAASSHLFIVPSSPTSWATGL